MLFFLLNKIVLVNWKEKDSGFVFFDSEDRRTSMGKREENADGNGKNGTSGEPRGQNE